MPRNASGTYTLPLPPVVPDTVIESVWANTTNDDVAQALTDSLDRYGRGSMVAPLRFVDGLVSAPGFAWQAETGTGFYRESAGVMSVAVLGAKVGQWSASGITMAAGKSLVSPSITVQGGLQGVLTISTTTTFLAGGAAVVSLNDPGGQGGYMGFGGVADTLELFNGRNGPITFSTNALQRLRIQADGNIVQSGTGTPVYAFQAGNNANYAGLDWRDSGGLPFSSFRAAKNPGPGGSELSFGVGLSGADPGFITFLTSGALRMKVTDATLSLENLQIDGVGNIFGISASNAYTVGANPVGTFQDGAFIQLYGSTAASEAGSLVLSAGSSVGRVLMYASGAERAILENAGQLYVKPPDGGGSSYEVGYRRVPKVSVTANGWVVTPEHVGKALSIDGSTFTTLIDATNGMLPGDVVTIINNTGYNTFIGCQNGAQFVLAGTTTVNGATRTLAPYGIATLWWGDGTFCWLSGNVS